MEFEPSASEAPVRDRRWLFWAFLVGALALDQYTKFAARAALNENQSLHWPLPGIFEITLTYNKGIAFGMFQGHGVWMAPVAIVMALGAMVFSLKNPKETRWNHAAMGLLSSGALGNLYDRIVHGKVTDMLYIRAIDFPVFNVADVCITAAAIMLVLVWVREAVRPPTIEGEISGPTPAGTGETEGAPSA